MNVSGRNVPSKRPEPRRCTITIVEPGSPAGANAVGTFEAVLSLAAGGTKAIANGRFDVPVMPLR